MDPPRAAQPLYDALHEAQSSLPDVQHSKLSHANHAAYTIPTQDTANDSILNSNRHSSNNNDHTSQTIQDIDNLLNSSAVSSLSNSTYSNSNNDHVSNRRRTMAHVPWTQVPPTEYTHTVHDSTDDTTNSLDNSAAYSSISDTITNTQANGTMNAPLAPAVQYAPFKHQSHNYSDNNHTYTTNFPANSHSHADTVSNNGDINNPASHVSNNVTQRRRPRSLPETRTDLYSSVPPAYLAMPTTSSAIHNDNNAPQKVPLGDSNDYLADVPRPAYATGATSVNQHSHSGGNKYNDSSLMEESCVASRIDEELECVTSNIDMLL